MSTPEQDPSGVETPPRKKTGCLGKVIAVVVVLGAISGIYTCVTGNTGNGVNNAKAKNGIATIKVDGYYFDQNSDASWWSLCDKIIDASKNDGVTEVHLDLHVTWKDKYGNETKAAYDVRMDDPSVRPISEIRKFQSGEDLYARYGMGFMAAYVLSTK